MDPQAEFTVNGKLDSYYTDWEYAEIQRVPTMFESLCEPLDFTAADLSQLSDPNWS